MDQYLTFAKDLAYKAGDIMLEHFKPGVGREVKSDDTPVTVADTTINKLVIDSVAEVFPEHSVLGEEESSSAADTEYIWVCDPIDGTIPYTIGIPTNLFSLALVHNGISVLGVLYDPYSKRMYEAVKSRGALLNGETIHVSNELTPQGYISLPGMQYGLTNTAELVRDAITSGMRSFSLCCITYESALIANGQIVGAIFPGKTPWDIAAVKIIVEEAGGMVTDLYGNEQRYDKPITGAVVSNGHMHARLVDLAKRHIA
ncbi:MAG TPA: inositol monophosphatase [Candidatus Saccharimonadales bacterium]|nr:inositol monophosphatase [Candidatus Saccharimonadales bacterium]